MVVLYGRTVRECKLCAVVRIGVVHSASKRLTVGSTCCAATAVVTNAEGRTLFVHGELVKSINVVVIVIVEYVTVTVKLVVSSVCITKENVGLNYCGSSDIARVNLCILEGGVYY